MKPDGGYEFMNLGFTFAAGILVFMGLGWLVDRWLGMLPVFTVTGTVVGAVLSFIYVYQLITAATDKDRDSRDKR
jgi:F0F1-type ATP synthase assembly protein I